jgi:hypothetical protein
MGEWMYGAIFSLPRYYLEVSGQLHAPVTLPPRKIPGYPIANLDDMEKRKFVSPPGF